MSCEHGLSQIVVKNEQVYYKESVYLKPCPYCALEQLDKYFTSGNEIPVERATILAKDYWSIRSGNE